MSCSCSLGGAKWYGEAEFWFVSTKHLGGCAAANAESTSQALIKIITIIGLIILGIVITAGGGPNVRAISSRVAL